MLNNLIYLNLNKIGMCLHLQYSNVWHYEVMTCKQLLGPQLRPWALKGLELITINLYNFSNTVHK